MKIFRLCCMPVIFFLLCFCLGCHTERNTELQQWKNAQGKIKVLSTIGMIDDLVKQVGGEHVAALTLIKGELDPHSYQLVKGDGEKLSIADVIFYNGLGLEHGPSLAHHLHSNSNCVGLGNCINEKFPERLLYYNNQLDPHIWMDISLWSETVPFIVETLSLHDPSHADEFYKNGQQLMESMRKIHGEVRNLLLSIPADKRFLVTSHDAFHYFTKAYLASDEEQVNGEWQKRFAAPEGLSPESQLSTSDIQAIIDHLSLHNIHVLFPESNVSKASIRKIISAGKERGLDLRIAEQPLYGDAMGPFENEGSAYLNMITLNASTLANCLNADNASTEQN